MLIRDQALNKWIAQLTVAHFSVHNGHRDHLQIGVAWRHKEIENRNKLKE